MKPSTIRVGVIGLGQIALKAHLPGYAKTKGCRITAVCSSREQHARNIAKQYGIPAIYKDWKKLIRSPEVDAVSICTPNFTHAPMTLKAFQEGKHVLVEKPMAMTVADAQRMIQASRRAKKVLMVHHNMRFDPAIRTVEMLLRKNVIGEVFSFKCTMAHRGPQDWSPKAKWFFNKRQAGGGVLMDLGPHLLHNICFMLADEPASVTAAIPRRKSAWMNQGEAQCSLLLRFKNGVTGTLNLGWADVYYQNRFYFYGSKGILLVNLAKGDPIIVEYRHNNRKVYPPLPKSAFKPSLYEHFLDCIRRHKEPWMSGAEGLKTVRLIEAGYKSDRLGQTIKL